MNDNFNPENFDDFDSDLLDNDFEGYEDDDFDGEDFDNEDFDGLDEDGFGEPDSIRGRGRARRAARKAQRVANRAAKKQRKYDHRAARQERRLASKERRQENRQAQRTARVIAKDSKAPTPMVDELNNQPPYDEQAAQQNMSEEQYQEQLIQPYQPQMQAMINRAGYQTSPSGNLAEDATRLMLARQQEIIRRQQAQLAALEEEGMSEDEMYTHVQSPDEVEEDMIREDMEWFGDSFDSFFPAVFGAIKKLGNKGIEAIKQNRDRKIAEAQAVAAREATLMQQLEDAKNRTGKAVKDYLPYIVIGVIVVAALTFTIIYFSKKK